MFLTITYSIISAIIIYAIFFLLPKYLKKKSKLQVAPASNEIVVSNIYIDHVKDYDDELIKIAKAAQAINNHIECNNVIRAIESFNDKYRELYGVYLVQIDVNMLCELVEKRYKRISNPLRVQVQF